MKQTVDAMFAEEAILAVDDEETILDIYEDILAQDGFRVVKAKDPLEALEIIKQQKIFLVLADFRMPKMNGATFCGKVKEFEPRIPVIIISAFSHEAKMSLEAARVGADDVISKPCPYGELTAIASRHARKRKEQIMAQLDGFTTVG